MGGTEERPVKESEKKILLEISGMCRVREKCYFGKSNIFDLFEQKYLLKNVIKSENNTFWSFLALFLCSKQHISGV